MSSSRYSARHRRNAMCMGLSVVAAAIGLIGLFMILVVLLWKGFAGLSLDVFTQMTPPPGSSRRSLECHRRQFDHDGDRRRRGHAAGHAGGNLSGGIRQVFEALHCRSLYQRHPAQRPLDRDRSFHLRDRCRSDGSLLGPRRRARLGGAGGSGRRTHNRRHVEPGAEHSARSRRGARHAAFPGHPTHRISRRESGSDHGRAACHRASERRDRAAFVHRAEQSVLQHEPLETDVEFADGDLSICAKPLQGLATVGLDRCADHHACCPGAQHRCPRPHGHGQQK